MIFLLRRILNHLQELGLLIGSLLLGGLVLVISLVGSVFPFILAFAFTDSTEAVRDRAIKTYMLSDLKSAEVYAKEAIGKGDDDPRLRWIVAYSVFMQNGTLTFLDDNAIQEGDSMYVSWCLLSLYSKAIAKQTSGQSVISEARDLYSKASHNEERALALLIIGNEYLRQGMLCLNSEPQAVDSVHQLLIRSASYYKRAHKLVPDNFLAAVSLVSIDMMPPALNEGYGPLITDTEFDEIGNKSEEFWAGNPLHTLLTRVCANCIKAMHELSINGLRFTPLSNQTTTLIRRQWS